MHNTKKDERKSQNIINFEFKCLQRKEAMIMNEQEEGGIVPTQPLLTVACMGIIRVIYREPGGGILFIPILVLASVSLLLSSSVLVAAFFFVSRKIHRTVSTGSHSSGGGIDDDDDKG